MKRDIERFRLRSVVVMICFIFIIVTVISSCATNGFMGFGDPLTTTSYVENTTADSAKRLTETEKELQKLTKEIDSMQSDVDSLKSIKMDLDEMPKEMLRQLVQALQSYLDVLEKE